jgi:hypothetical protein
MVTSDEAMARPMTMRPRAATLQREAVAMDQRDAREVSHAFGEFRRARRAGYTGAIVASTVLHRRSILIANYFPLRIPT